MFIKITHIQKFITNTVQYNTFKELFKSSFFTLAGIDNIHNHFVEEFAANKVHFAADMC